MGEADLDPETIRELTRLSTTYAMAADDRDVAGFLGVFTEDALLEVDDGSGRGARTRGRLTIAERASEVTMRIRYRDRYRHTADGWRIAHRRVVVDWATTNTVELLG